MQHQHDLSVARTLVEVMHLHARAGFESVTFERVIGELHGAKTKGCDEYDAL